MFKENEKVRRYLLKMFVSRVGAFWRDPLCELWRMPRSVRCAEIVRGPSVRLLVGVSSVQDDENVHSPRVGCMTI